MTLFDDLLLSIGIGLILVTAELTMILGICCMVKYLEKK